MRLIDPESNTQDIVPTEEAQRRADEVSLDLVAVSPTAEPPVCKILDYSHYIYNQGKLEKKARKHTKSGVVKELKLSCKISENDFQVRHRAAIRFLNKGYKVKFTIFFRGREITHPDVGLSLLRRLCDELKDMAVVEFGPQFNGPVANMVLSPKK